MNFAPLGAVVLAAIAIATLAVASVATAHATRGALTEYRALSTSQSQVILTERDLIDEETGIRGYAATGDRTLLAPYVLGVRHIPQDLAVLSKDLADAQRADMLDDVAHLASLEAQWNAEVALPTLAARDPRANSAAQERGKSIVDRFRDVDLSMEHDLRSQLARLFDHLTTNIRLVTFIAALLFAFVGIIFAFVWVSASRTRSRAHEEFQLRTLVAAMPQIVWVSGIDGRVIYFNARWYDYTGQTLEESLEGGWIKAIHPEERGKTLALWDASVRSGVGFDAEYRLRSASGEYQWFVTRALPERSERGTIVRWLGTCTDVNSQHTQLESVQRVADAFALAQLPDHLPATPYVAFDATYLPAEDVAQVGGDWYDAFALDDARFFFSVGDVTGHGLQAALTMSRVRQAIVAFASVDTDPASILERANRVLSMHRESMATALCGVFDARTGRVHYASAGHPPSLILRASGEIEELSSHAPPLGIIDRIAVVSQQARLHPGDRLVCYTDGIIENDRDVLGGEDTLRKVLGALTPFEYREPARAIRERILGGRRGRDDIAILVITRLDPGGVTHPAETHERAMGKG